MAIDLHIHTTASDGAYTPSQVAEEAKRLGLTVIGITDHDTMDGVEEAARRGRELGIEVVPGIELNTDYHDREIHILGYYPDPHSDKFQGILKELRDARINRIQTMVANLKQLGYPVSYDRVKEIAGEGSIGRPHLAKAILEAGYAAEWSEVFDRFIGSGCPAYVPRTKLTPTAAVELILKVGGVPVLAHPGLNDADEMIPELVEAGLRGIEVFHYDHTAEDVVHYLQVAGEYRLIITGGSDCHGPGVKSGVRLGEVMLPDSYLAGLKEAKQILEEKLIF